MKRNNKLLQSECVEVGSGKRCRQAYSPEEWCRIVCLMLFLMMTSAGRLWADKVTPAVSFSSSSLTATVGQLKFTRPTLNVTADGKSVRRCFTQSWAISGGTEGTDEYGRPISTDATTGTTVLTRYGGVTIGKKTGTVTVTVTLIPTDAYEDKYNSATASYTIDIQKPEVVMDYYNGTTLLNGETPSTLQFYSLKNGNNGQFFTTNAVPTPHFYYVLEGSDHDVSDCYDFTYAVTTGYAVSQDHKTLSTTIAAEAGGEGTLTITATPKKAYQGMLGSASTTTTIAMKTTYRTEKIKTYLSFASHEMDVLRSRNTYDDSKGKCELSYSPEIIVKDEFGNDLSALIQRYDLFHLSTSAQSVFHQYTTDPHDSTDENNYLYHVNTDYLCAYTPFRNAKNQVVSLMGPHTHPDDYIVTVTATQPDQWNTVLGAVASVYATPVAYQDSVVVDGQFYDPYDEKCKNNQYKLASNQFVLRSHKRVPQIVLTPDPKSVTIAEKYEMTSFNRFNVKGVITDPYDDEDPADTVSYEKAEFWYWFFVPDKYKYDESKTEAENLQRATTLGHALIRVTTEASNIQGAIQDCWEWVPEYDGSGNAVMDAHGRQQKDLMHGTYYRSMKNWGNENFKVTFYGPNLTVPVIYKINPWDKQHQNVGVSGSCAFRVVEREPTHFVIDPEKQVGSAGSTVPCPDIQVADQFGADVTDQFDVTKSQAATSTDWTLAADGSVTSNTAVNCTVNVNGTLKTTSTQPFNNPDPGSYEVDFKEGSKGSTGAYEVIYDADHDEKMGKLHFVTAGDFFPGTTCYHEVPGINITFGSSADAENVWQLFTSAVTDPSYFNDDLHGADNDKDWADAKTKTTLAKVSLKADAMEQGDDGLPVSGGFLKIDAVTNGWLYIDGNFQYNSTTKHGRHYVISDAKTKEEQTIGFVKDAAHPDGLNIAEVKFPKPLLAGHTYYIWGDDGGMRIHGLRYEPAFIDPVTDNLPWAHTGAVDTEPVSASTAFLNGLTGTLPTLAFHREDATLRWYCDDVESGSASTSVDAIGKRKDEEGKHVTINTRNGIVVGTAMTNELPLTDASRTGYANGRVRVYAEVMGVKHADGNQVMKTPYYYLFVGDLPTYIVKEGENHDQDERVSTTNIPTRIFMTFGGWHWTGNKCYPYYKNNDPTKDWIDDEWKTAKMDSVGHNEQTIDGFNYICWGAQDPTDENVRSWSKGVRNTFNLPVRGTYLKFEPEESGRLLLYVAMNGMTDNSNGDDQKKLDKNGPWLRRRALYIVDETGKPVAIDENSGWEKRYNWGNYVNSGKTNADRFKGYRNYCYNYFCDGVTRCAWKYDGTHDLTIWDKAENADPEMKKYSWKNAYDRDQNGVLDDKEQANLDNDYAKIKNWWTADQYSYDKVVDGDRLQSSLTHPKLGGPLEVLQLSDSSYVLPTKGYARFTFKVQAGKVYYVFMTGSKLGFCGFGFIPSSYRAHITRWTSHNSDEKNIDGTAYTQTTYDALPQPTDEIYKPGATGNDRLMGGTVTLDLSKKSTEEGSYSKWKANGFALDGDCTPESGCTLVNNTARDFVNVSLKRSILNERWAGICLPFTVSETQMKEVFGEDMQLITVDSVMASEGHTKCLHFTQHSNRLLEAGRPYFIYPKVSGVNAGEPIGNDGVITFKGVSLQGVDPKTVILTNEAVVAHNDSVTKGLAADSVHIFTYKICGNYDQAIIPWYSYYMKRSADEDTNKFFRIIPAVVTDDKGAYLPGCNSWLYPYSADAEGKKLFVDAETDAGAKVADFWITGAEVAGDTATGIDELVEALNTQATTVHEGVYDLRGHCVRAVNSLEGLPAGVYVMNGRKYVVK
ncbi:MAG: hypothetical protein PUD15_06345 [Prevotella sp.]|nr:hypothetical protein [Prevotella sp.]